MGVSCSTTNKKKKKRFYLVLCLYIVSPTAYLMVLDHLSILLTNSYSKNNIEFTLRWEAWLL